MIYITVLMHSSVLGMGIFQLLGVLHLHTTVQVLLDTPFGGMYSSLPINYEQ